MNRFDYKDDSLDIQRKKKGFNPTATDIKKAKQNFYNRSEPEGCRACNVPNFVFADLYCSKCIEK